MKMVHEVKNRKTKLPQLRIIIDFLVRCAVLAVIIGLLYVCGTSISAVIGVYLGYRVLRLVLRLMCMVLSSVFTAVSIIILILIISLLIF
jgi:hypothetical protein